MNIEKIAEYKKQIYKKAFTVTPAAKRYMGMAGAGAAGGGAFGAIQGWRYSDAVKSKGEKRKKHIRNGAIAGAVLGGVGLPLYWRELEKEMGGHTNYGNAGGYGGYGHGGAGGGGSSGNRYSRGNASGFGSHGADHSAFKEFDVDLKGAKTKDEVKKAYKNLMKKYHPDVNKAPDAGEKAKKINSIMDDVAKSNWYQKLAFWFQASLEKLG